MLCLVAAWDDLSLGELLLTGRETVEFDTTPLSLHLCFIKRKKIFKGLEGAPRQHSHILD
jgi:hypothetical protein